MYIVIDRMSVIFDGYYGACSFFPHDFAEAEQATVAQLVVDFEGSQKASTEKECLSSSLTSRKILFEGEKVEARSELVIVFGHHRQACFAPSPQRLLRGLLQLSI